MPTSNQATPYGFKKTLNDLKADDPEIVEKMQHLVREEGFVRASVILGVATMTLQKVINGGWARPSTLNIMREGYDRYYHVKPRSDGNCPFCCVVPLERETAHIVEDRLACCADCGLLHQAVEQLLSTEAGRQEVRVLLKKKTPQFGL